MSYTTRRHGLTLLELVVVLVILVALAGILAPLLPGMLGRAHTAEHGTNVGEINKAVEAYNLIQRGYPNNLDDLNLFTATSILPGGSATGACGGDLIPDTAELTQAEVDSLRAAGITKVWTPTGTDLVANPYGTATSGSTLTATTSTVAVLSAAAKYRLYNDGDGTTSGGAKYVVFGLGPKCDMIGKPGGMPEAPLHFSDEKSTGGDPNKTYARYGLVFRISDGTGPLKRAQFVGTLALHEDALSGANAAVAEFHEQNPQ
jgi:prepilin-type N-terminal cleavage/methylation domain-containing protein